MDSNDTLNAKSSYSSILTFLILLLSLHSFAQLSSQKKGKDTLNNAIKSTKLPSNTSAVNSDSVSKAKNVQDSTRLKSKKDSLQQKVDTLNLSKDSLDAPVRYVAQDSGVINLVTKVFTLYGKSKIDYKTTSLSAGQIEYNQSTQIVKAFGARDTTNNPLNKPQFSDGDQKSISDSIFFNMKSLKGLTKNTYYQEGELFVNATTLKKVDKDVYYAYRGRFTTCNLDTPHFAFRTRKMKMIANKMAFTGPTWPEIEQVPIPIGVPFGIFPLARGRHSGFLAPQFATSEDFGLGLEGLGYYKVLSDYWDATVRSNIYSYGGWSVNVAPRYYKRYRYTGSMSITFQKTRTLNRNASSLEEFNDVKSYMINWNHARDNRARPGTSFSASVNFGSTRFNQTVLNNPYQNFQNQLSSSVSYTKDWRGKSNIAVTANHNQNSVTRLVNMSLPNISYNVNAIYPFQKKEKVGESKWYENLSIGYSTNFSNQISFYDTAVTLKRLIDTIQWGATHNIPISLTLPPIGPITVSPSISYQEHWLAQKIIRTWSASNKKVDTAITKGLFTARAMSFGISGNSRIFGTYTFPHSKNIVAIRHEVRPSVGLSYTPDLNAQNHYSTQVDTLGHFQRFGKYDGVTPGGFGEGVFGGISFGLDNILEMKLRDSKDTAKGTKKVKLIDGFSINGNYNLLADSFALSNFSINLRTTIFKNINITASTTLDPYNIDKYGYRKKQLMWGNKSFSPGRITNGTIAISTQFKGGAIDKKTDQQRITPDPFLTPDEQQRQLQYARANPAEYSDFNIPWNLSLSYSLSFSKSIKRDYSGFATTINSSVNFNGDFNLTPKWKVGTNGYFDFNAGKLQQISTFISREMHCWQLSINVNPIGIYRSFSFTLNPKSGILRDLKINRSRTFTNY